MSTRQEELQDEIIDLATLMANVLPRPEEWDSYLQELLEVLEGEAMEIDPNHPEQYNLLLVRLREAIHNRLDQGEW